MTVGAESRSENMIDSIRVIIACAQPILREGLSRILEADKRIEISAKASDLLDLIKSCEDFKCDIMLLDVDLGGLNHTKMLRLLKKNKSTKVILLLDSDYNENNLLSAIRNGVRGYLFRNTDSNQFIKSIKCVNDGELWVERKTMVKVFESFSISPKDKKSKGSTSIYNLTETQTKIVKLVLAGLSNKNIAKDLYISEKTVKFHLYKIYKQFFVKNRSQLILYFIKKAL
jgi:DNA-binding NarL/FixJ family response regulator